MPELSPDAAIAIVRCLYPAAGAVIDARRVPRAYDHELWHIAAAHGQVALRLARLSTAPARLANAVAAQRLASAHGVPTARILAYDDGALLGRPLTIQEWVPGVDAETAWPDLGREERRRFAYSFGRAVAQLHAVPGPRFSDDITLHRALPSWPEGLRRYLAKYAARLRSAGLLPPPTLVAAVGHLETGIAALPPDIQPALTRWDLWLANALVRDSTCIGLIDWESASFADPLVDFVKLDVFVFAPYPETHEPFLAGYRERLPLPGDADRRLHVYRGLEYLAAVFREAALGELGRATTYRSRLERWVEQGE